MLLCSQGSCNNEKMNVAKTVPPPPPGSVVSPAQQSCGSGNRKCLCCHKVAGCSPALYTFDVVVFCLQQG